VGHVQEWRQQFSRLDSVDLRYEHQIIVNPDLQGTVKQPPMPQSAVRAAMAEGVKPAALTTHVPSSAAAAGAIDAAAKPVVKPSSARKRVARSRHRKPGLKKVNSQTKSRVAPAALQSGPAGGAKPPAAPSAANPAAPATGDTNKTGNKPSPGIPKGQQQ